jgi:hypothetical protein
MNGRTPWLLVFVIVGFLAILVGAVFWQENLALWDNVLHFGFHFLDWVSDFFQDQPDHFWAVSAVFGVLFVAALLAKTRFPKIHCWPLLIAFLMWLVFGFLERDNVIHKANIRIDILLIWPFFFAGTALLIVLFIGLFILGLVRAARSAKEESRNGDGASSLSLGLIRAVRAAKGESRGDAASSSPCSPLDQPPAPDND